VPRAIPSTYLLARRLMRKTSAVFELAEIELTSGTVARVANSPVNVEAGGHVWQAAGFAVQGLGDDGEGSLPRITLTISNVRREPSAQLESGAVLGRPVRLWLVSETDLDDLPAALAWTYTALSAAVNRKTATVECGLPSRLVAVPGMVYEIQRFPGILRRPPS